jgi:SAM-dependent methyltransferase
MSLGERIPLPVKQRVRRALNPIRLGILNQTAPFHDSGWHRGTPVDRVYMAHFLEQHRGDIRGRVLEVKDSDYTDRFGSDVAESVVLDIDPANPHVTLVADLARPEQLPADAFDCFILTQTLQYPDDLAAAIRSTHRVLRPGGVVLATMPAIAQFEQHSGDDRWRLTPAGWSAMFTPVFGAENTTVMSYGNLLTAVAALKGLAAEELRDQDLWVPARELCTLVAVRAVKAASIPEPA